MAANVLKPARMVFYFPSLRAVVNHLNRPLSSGIATASNIQQSAHYLANQDLGPFADKDPMFPLPGNMNIDVGLKQKKDFQLTANQQSLASAFLDVETKEVKKHHALVTFLNNTKMDELKSTKLDKQKAVNEKVNNVTDNVECSVQQCSPSLQKSFSELFPDVKLEPGKMTVVNICQHTENDMTSWSEAVQAEREMLLENFIESAKEICETLKTQGYWADFIDPSSGNAYFGSYTNATFFEIDERYNQLGYRIMDLGCCKAISHHLWGTFAYVGSIFTNAPTDSLSLQTALGNNQ